MLVNIIDFGAAADAAAPQTEYIQKAIDDVFLSGGGEVVVPAGTFLTGGIRLRSGVTLRLKSGARLKGTRDPKDYFAWKNDSLEPFPAEEITDALHIPARADYGARDDSFLTKAGSSWNNGLIRAYRARNIAIIGEEGSVIDGSDCYDPNGEEKYRGPHLISIRKCENVTFEGYTTVDSANWAHAIFESRNITARNVTCIAGHDGIHPRLCDNVLIENCTFKTGDDCIGGFADTNMIVRNCVFNTACSAMRLGGTNILVHDCRFYGPAEYVFRGSLSLEEKISGAPARKTPGHRYNMLSVFTYFADTCLPIAEQPGNIVIRDCTVENVDRFLHYNFSGNELWQKGRPLADITFENVTASGIRMPLTAYALDVLPIRLAITGCRIGFSADAEEKCFIRTHAYERITLKNTSVSGCAGGALIKSWGGDGILETDGLTHDADEFLTHPDTDFFCRAI